ncbi:MAG: zinc metallopeptidase [Phycisphaerales bacterium]|nr:zinc metallopeptidase [Phycisphaerales bacterium]
MRTDRMRESQNVEDRRRAGPRIAVGGGIGGIILVIIVILMGGNPAQLLNQMNQGGGPLALPSGPAGPAGPLSAAEEAQADFVRRVLGDTEDVWSDLFARAGRTYAEPTLVLFSDRVESACGIAGAATGPFYCPADSKVYIDLSFYDDLATRFGAPGDFAQAYVIAHEVGHHIQNLLGTAEKVHSARGRVSEAEYNDLSVRLELQADYLAGVWAHHAQTSRQILESGDVEEALRCAAAIGDDRLQRQAQGYVVPESFTHGTSEQRARWFRMGLETGDINTHNPFTVPTP